jgi:hypothetical protein
MGRQYQKRFVGFGSPSPAQLMREAEFNSLDYLEAERALTALIEAETSFELVDCGMLFNYDGTPATNYRDAVYEDPDGTELEFKVFIQPLRVEASGAIPDTVRACVERWMAGNGS